MSAIERAGKDMIDLCGKMVKIKSSTRKEKSTSATLVRAELLKFAECERRLKRDSTPPTVRSGRTTVTSAKAVEEICSAKPQTGDTEYRSAQPCACAAISRRHISTSNGSAPPSCTENYPLRHQLAPDIAHPTLCMLAPPSCATSSSPTRRLRQRLAQAPSTNPSAPPSRRRPPTSCVVVEEN
ncbi:hypothetical protein B0H16DRAFT_1741771 [Mycena metata]|uniref:Uncharacterized protein n=1 Tax=Mycena metata TaxID=1033252 RepID=A0AAD7H9Z7_9AGAR|nr:hypothetical protein B0H16DRAFT_1741771 [Mycena metata]